LSGVYGETSGDHGIEDVRGEYKAERVIDMAAFAPELVRRRAAAVPCFPATPATAAPPPSALC
jgi:hypothetical protein